jgi:riboflavin biosynthesis pyrimidine reductase
MANTAAINSAVMMIAGVDVGGDARLSARRLAARRRRRRPLAVQQLKRESGKGLFVGGVKLPLALAELGLIDEYEFVVQPRLAGHGPTLFAGLSTYLDLKLVNRLLLPLIHWLSADRPWGILRPAMPTKPH